MNHFSAEPPTCPFWRRYIFSTDHKVIGIQYALTVLVFTLFGFMLTLLMRWQLAYPGRPLPIIGGLFSDEHLLMPGGVMAPEFYNSLGVMHVTSMVFLAVVPLAVGSFGNYLIPLQTGAPSIVRLISSRFLPVQHSPGGTARFTSKETWNFQRGSFNHENKRSRSSSFSLSRWAKNSSKSSSFSSSRSDSQLSNSSSWRTVTYPRMR